MSEVPSEVLRFRAAPECSGVTHIRFPFGGGRFPLDLGFRGPLEAKSFVRGRKIYPPGAPGRVFDLKRAILWSYPPLCPRMVSLVFVRVVPNRTQRCQAIEFRRLRAELAEAEQELAKVGTSHPRGVVLWRPIDGQAYRRANLPTPYKFIGFGEVCPSIGLPVGRAP
jgi:hypothetical protein